MSKIPDKPLIRLRHVLNWLGVEERDVHKWVEAGVIHPVRLVPGSRAFYKTKELAEKILGIQV